MSENKIEYLKNKNGEIISPIVSTKSIFDENGTSLENLIGDMDTALDTILGEEI